MSYEIQEMKASIYQKEKHHQEMRTTFFLSKIKYSKKQKRSDDQEHLG